MRQLHGVNLGNWLVLERWMDETPFEGTDEATVPDETWLARTLDNATLAARLRHHRDTYITENDFAAIARLGLDFVRLPVPYFVFGDRSPFVGCVEYVDRALAWAKAYGLSVLLDLHTVPGSQNGFDNGGLLGVCTWHTTRRGDPDEVEFALGVLERLARRYGTHPALFGIEALNEPVSPELFASRGDHARAVDAVEARGSEGVPTEFLHEFYLEAYRRLRPLLPADKAIVFHEGFRPFIWREFFSARGPAAHMRGVMLDTHPYLASIERELGLPATGWAYRTTALIARRVLRDMAREVPVMVGEWCLENGWARKLGPDARHAGRRRARRYRATAAMERWAFGPCAATCFWSWQMLREDRATLLGTWREGWDMRLAVERGWLHYNR